MRKSKHKAEALNLFMLDKTPEEIAKTLGVKRETVYKWKQRDKWANLRERNRPAEALAFIIPLLQQERERRPEEAKVITGHLLTIHEALVDPGKLLSERIASALADIEKALKDNLA